MLNEIDRIVARLRTAICEGAFSEAVVRDAIDDLKAVGFCYKSKLFPALPAEHEWGRASKTAPETLAEALLWKMGKWPVYQQFASYYAEEVDQSKGTDVVFFAFAKYLQDRENPIYDQHALRALWAIDSCMKDLDIATCKSVLVANGNEWKSVAGGSETIKAYELYCKRVKQLCSLSNSPSKDDLDKLLMPLGQALKTHKKPDSFPQNVVAVSDDARSAKG